MILLVMVVMNVAVNYQVMKINNLFNNVPLQTENEVFEVVWETPTFLLERIISTGQTTPDGEWYDQAQAEWVIVLQGRATLMVEETEYHLNTGDYILIPAHRRHRVIQTETPTVWLALHAKSL
jgi:cupin 2 domain-containing protein